MTNVSERATAIVEARVRDWMAGLEFSPRDEDVFGQAITIAQYEEECGGWREVGSPCFGAITFGRTSPSHYAATVLKRIRPEARI